MTLLQKVVRCISPYRHQQLPLTPYYFFPLVAAVRLHGLSGSTRFRISEQLSLKKALHLESALLELPMGSTGKTGALTLASATVVLDGALETGKAMMGFESIIIGRLFLHDDKISWEIVRTLCLFIISVRKRVHIPRVYHRCCTQARWLLALLLVPDTYVAMER